jgi:RNA polymerase sigma factor (sigma-70 family)
MSSPPDPARQYDDSEKRQFVHQAIERLPERSRQVVCLHYLSGLSHQEIAAALAEKVGAGSGGTGRNVR